MNFKVNVNVSAAAILERRGLGKSTKAKKYLAATVKRLCDPYVPKRSGMLKNRAEVTESGGQVALEYEEPYAHYQYHGEVMAGRAPKHYTGRAIDYADGPMRGKEWGKRMMADRGDEVVDALAGYVGGERK